MASQDQNLLNSKTDYAVSLAKSVLGVIPTVGTALSELVSIAIPNQRLERVTKYLIDLEKRMSLMEVDLKAKVVDVDFSDLVEESLWQAARAVSQDRLDYIATLVVNGVSASNIEYIESKHLLKILSELNDIEIIWLRFYLNPVMSGDKEFRQKHEELLYPKVAFFESSQEEIDKSTLQVSYKNHLATLGLLEKKVEIDLGDARGRAKTKTTGYEITSLGGLILRQIGLGEIGN